MTMNFRTIKDSIVNNVLGPAEAGRFSTVGYQRQSRAAVQSGVGITTVQVFYSGSDISKSNRLVGPVNHDATYKVELTVSRAARGDLSLINDPGASPDQLAAALAAFQDAAELADVAFDELTEVVFQILMDGRNFDMGLSKGVLSSRWISSIQKDNPLPRGRVVVLTGYMNLTLKTVEQITGDTGTAAESITTTFQIEGDNVTDSEVTVSLEG